MIVVSVDDDARDRDFVQRSLHKQQYTVEDFGNAIDALQYIRDNGADVMLIDYKLPRGPDGLLLAKQVRQILPECVIVMISAFAEREHIIEAFRSGVDDFILKGKISPEQLIQIIDAAILKRQAAQPVFQSTLRHVYDLEMDTPGRATIWYGERLRLTSMEFDILSQLTAKPGRVFSFAELDFLITGEHIDPTLSRPKIKTHVTNLRRKLEQAGRYPQTIFSVYGKGFKWDDSGRMSERNADDEQEDSAVAGI